MLEIMQKQRSPLFDVVKFYLMYWVVRGHLLAQGIVAGSVAWPKLNSVVTNSVVGASMPLFFMISGYFAYSMFNERAWDKLAARVICLLWPVLAFGCVFGAYLLCRTGDFHFLAFPFHFVKRLWFLRTLVILHLIVAIVVIMAKTERQKWFLILLAYIALIINPARFGAWYLRNVMHMFPYFIFGLFVLRRRELFRDWKVSLMCGLAFIVIVLTEGPCSTNGMGFYWVSSYWKDMLLTSHGLLCFFGRTFVGITGSIFTLWAIDRLILCVPAVAHFAVFGTTTLGVYVMHEWCLGRIGAHSPFPFPVSYREIIALVVFFVFHFLVIAMKRVRWIRMLFFGDEAMVRKWFNRRSARVVL